MSDARERFSPGPWTTQHCPNGGRIVLRAVEPIGHHPQSHVQIVPTADAYLIAAAPDLYEALRLMLSHGERCNWFADSGDDEVCAKAIAALAKARGEPHG